MNYTFKVASFPGAPLPDDPAARGGFHLISPHEALDAFILRVSKAIEQGDDLSMWKQMAQTANIRFVAVQNEEAANWMSIQAREDIGHSFESLFRTALGRTFEVISFIDTDEAMTPKALEMLWRTNVNQSSMGDRTQGAIKNPTE